MPLVTPPYDRLCLSRVASGDKYGSISWGDLTYCIADNLLQSMNTPVRLHAHAEVVWVAILRLPARVTTW
jgi:hypothetical protein